MPCQSYEPETIARGLKRVLIADDNEIMRNLICSFLEQDRGLEICALTSTGPETLKTALALKPDLLVLDIVMPGLSGVEVASVVKKSQPRAKIVIFTMYGDTLGQNLAKIIGVDAVVPKSEGLVSLAETVNSVLKASSLEH